MRFSLSYGVICSNSPEGKRPLPKEEKLVQKESCVNGKGGQVVVQLHLILIDGYMSSKSGPKVYLAI